MSFTNNELKYTECDVCGHEKECHITCEYGEDRAVCPTCLSIANRD